MQNSSYYHIHQNDSTVIKGLHKESMRERKRERALDNQHHRCELNGPLNGIFCTLIVDMPVTPTVVRQRFSRLRENGMLMKIAFCKCP